MLFHKKDVHIVDNCRFCFMCRHVCPVAMATGSELHNARARAELLSLVLRGREYSADLAAAQYECVLCGACTEQCATAFDPPSFTRSARLEAVISGVAPNALTALIQSILQNGTPYTSKQDANLERAISHLPPSADTLLYLGAARHLQPDSAAAAMRLMQLAGESFTVLGDEPYSACDLFDMMGAAEEVRELAASTAARLSDSGAKTIVCLSPDDARIFIREYREWGLELHVKTFTALASEWLQRGVLKPRKQDMTVTYQDPYHLSRELGETDAARTVIRACAGLVEMVRHGREAISCGEGAISIYLPLLAEKMAVRRKADIPEAAQRIVTACPRCLKLFQSVGVAAVAIEKLLLECLEGGEAS